MTDAQIEFLAGHFRRPPAEAYQVRDYVEGVLGAPPPLGVALPSRRIFRIVEIGAELAELSERDRREPGSWLAMVKRVGDLLRMGEPESMLVVSAPTAE